ncbi:MAG TPA: histidine decarboxylase [Cyanobacteria bacterium UBA12227]|nr:histidine decarboxylase [Cyanobacteria bacterium UBA12227]HAX86878.1 histidine decarboxylase [Cyanobacteria bacterium UBA11370]HBY79844.1 histidine decarboxylase [Cyanobacteria bacterium UBA11148]
MASVIFQELAALLNHVKQQTSLHAGYPFNLNYDYKQLLKFFDYSVINLGDPFIDSNYKVDSKKFEKEVLSFFAELYKISPEDSWGYVTSGGTEGNLYGIFLGRECYPDGLLYFSEDSHYSIPKAARLFRIPSVVVRSQKNGEIDYEHLAEMLQKNCHLPAIINLNIGTTMKGAIDDLDRVVDTLEKNHIQNYYIHCDAALFGMMLPFLADSPQIDFTKPIGSVAISGHKFIGTPIPCGIVLSRNYLIKKIETNIEYIASKDTTILGSRNGQAPIFLWYALRTRGYQGFAQEVKVCLQNAQYLFEQLKSIGCSCLLNPFSNTVLFQRPPEPLVEKWQLSTMENWAHIVVMQNITQETIDTFVNDFRGVLLSNCA